MEPSPPVNVKCPVNSKDRSLEITWDAPDHPNGIIQYYKVYVYYGNGATKEVNPTTGPVTTFNVQNLTPGICLII
ncbi:hypothetical protein FSP39_008094 [Pinctada imbricata]|uniref:Fibronectin type-III domain-containing protein n=1 Tax=Pinctada imbricata TaxID=66713 RepID=A0AA88Y385_PINIB|nr:hypothetical protein FSP39_008094 [Pinctada imbricata]